MRCHGSKAAQQFSVLGRTVLPGLPLGQEAKRQGIQLDRPIESLGVTCSEPRIEVQCQGIQFDSPTVSLGVT
jgi:hypothetical protein